MDFVRASGPLLRSSQPLLPFLAPSVSYRSASVPLAHRPSRRKVWHHEHSSRSFTTSHTRQQESTSAGSTQSRTRNSSPPSKPSVSDEFNAILDSALDGSKGVATAPTGRTSRFATSRAQTANSQSRTMAARQQERYNDAATSRQQQRDGGGGEEQGGALAELFKEVASTSHMRPSQGGGGGSRTPMTMAARQQQQQQQQQLQQRGDFLDISQMLDPLSNTNLPSPTQTMATSRPPPVVAPQAPPVKLNSSIGRTIPVDNARGMDIGRAFRALEMTCARNSVRRDFMRQRFHERPGLKRKRLRSERWRRRFKEAFRGTIGAVQRMRGQGW